MEKIFNPMLIGTVAKSITFQGIGGKEIIIEREVNIDDTPGTIALWQFMERTMNAGKIIPSKAYYGHIGGLGYFVGKDEVSNIREATNRDIRRVW